MFLKKVMEYFLHDDVGGKCNVCGMGMLTEVLIRSSQFGNI
ncbi:hypothetical protein [Aquimarina sp. Aq78]|nr:hypothetical protein [Aquimarina sp. Aq78]